jgi:hypothetical protein
MRSWLPAGGAGWAASPITKNQRLAFLPAWHCPTPLWIPRHQISLIARGGPSFTGSAMFGATLDRAAIPKGTKTIECVLCLIRAFEATGSRFLPLKGRPVPDKKSYMGKQAL